MTELCRLCGDFALSESTASDLTIVEPTIKCQLETHLKLFLDHDKLLPQFVCAACAETLSKCSRFVMRVNEVEERLKLQLMEQLSDFPCEEFQTFELKIERLDEIEPKKKKKVKKKEPTAKSRVSRRNRGVKMARDVIKYTMESLFPSELKGEFTDEVASASSEPPNTVGWCSYEWKCKGCHGVFANVIDLERHSIACTKRRCVNHCQHCIKDFPNYSTFLNHIAMRHEPALKFCCIVCSEFKKNLIELYQHVESEHSDYHNIFFCLYCGKYYFTGAHLRDHIVIHRPDIILPKFSCDICPFTTVKKHTLLSHMSRFHLDRRFTCECCASSFTYHAELVQHQQVKHNDECNEVCKACGKRFKNKRKLRRHVHNVHEPRSEVFACEHCGKVARNKKSLVTHMRVHSDKNSYQCVYCPRSFRHASGFAYHVRTHTGERPYMCPICDQKFIDWPNCSKHIKTSHNETDVKPVQLSIKN